MLFSSIEFILFFFPVVYAVYCILPLKAKNYWLMLASLFFYAWGEPRFVLVMMGSICANFFLALGIEKTRERRLSPKLLMAADIAVNLGILMVFKYMNFMTHTLRAWLPMTRRFVPATSIALPIGISFFTFQALSYVIDVYRGLPAQRNIAYLALYISLFPQLIAGPIVRYNTIADQIYARKVGFDDLSEGMLRFMTGFSKKILLANTLAEVADAAFALHSRSVLMAWTGAVCYALQIYFDFSGYSDMAIGLGRMFGFHFLENFDYPYLSQTVTEFWRRWHISLGTWFRDYVYYPLGGSRVGSRRRLVFNLLVVWLLTGVWHGANWTFILWGLLYGCAIIFEKLTGIPKAIRNWPAPARAGYRLLTLLAITLGWVLFRADHLKDAWWYFRGMLGIAGNAVSGDDFIFYGREYLAYIAAGLLCATPVFNGIKRRLIAANGALAGAVECASDVVRLALFVISFTMLVISAHNPFIYFNF